jgi:DNA-binding CsgD family transcriptional regulator/tetratricopeptide (TPR) repeat protein
MTGMARRTTSPRLVGRDRELADLLDAIGSDDPDRPLILVAGEAGIGKTRLLGEAIERVRAPGGEPPALPWNVVRGSCLRLAEGELPFAPILEVLDAIREQGLTDRADWARARLTGTDSSPSGSADARTVRFVEIHDALSDAATAAPLLVVLDDLHWADRSTLDLLLFLARRLRGGRVVMLAGYRSDELHRRHPLRPILAELGRGFVRERIDLEPLGREAVTEQIAELGPSIDPDLVGGIVARADGNPFYVEELVALGSGRKGLPDSVRDVLLARVAALEPEAIRVLGACAVVGREADEPLLARVTGLADAAISEALRAAVDQAILVAEPAGGYRFRHALLEEAVHDDLLPSERVNLHRRVADALRDSASKPGAARVAPGELARHLDLAGRPGPAIDAYLDAADIAFRALAWSEGVTAYERAVELAASLSGGVDGGSGQRLRDLTITAAMATNWSGAPARAIAILRQAIADAEAAGDTETAASMLVTLSRILNDSGDEAGSAAATLSAVALFPPTEATALGVDLLLDLAAGAWNAGRTRDAIGLAERAVTGAESLGDHKLLFRALIHRGEARIGAGQVPDGMADVDRARQLQAEHGWLDTYGFLATNIGVSLADAGFLDEALSAWQEGLRMSRELGVTNSWDPWNLPGLAYHALLAGRWPDADAPLAAGRAFRVRGLPMFFTELVAAHLAAGRGDLDACERALRLSAEGAIGMRGEIEAFIGYGHVARAEAAGDPAARLAAAESALRKLDGLDTFVLRSRLAVEIAAAAADLVVSLHPRRDQVHIESLRARANAAVALAADVDEGRAIEGTSSVPWTRANVAFASAEAALAHGTDAPADWLAVADAFRAIGMLPRVAYGQYRAAGAAIRAGDRVAGNAHLRGAFELATSIGMTSLLRRIEELARAARIDLAAPAPQARERDEPADRWGLSGRELEVLALVAEGRTNGEIGARLFISNKTASVHVTHILDKLGVSTRTEAALLASRAGLLEGQLRSPE